MAKKILIVDDEEAIAMLLREILEAHGYTAEMVYTGDNVLAKVAEYHPDMILLDIMLPGIDGFQVLELLKSKPETQMIPVVMVSTLKRKDSMEKAQKLGACGFVPKPFESLDVIDKVKEIVGEGS